MRYGERFREDGGAVAIVTALLLTVLLLFSAFVIDIGAMRADRALNQSVADLAAAAAVQEHLAVQAGSSFQACEDAVEYVERNLGLTVAPVGGVDGCEIFLTGFTPPDVDVCDPLTPLLATYEAGPYLIQISNPVLDADADTTGLMQGANYGATDGTPCDRVGVRIERDRDFVLAPAGGSGLTQGRVSASAVAQRRFDEQAAEYASLVILERQACQTLQLSGGSLLSVVNTVTADGTFEGSVTVDSLPPSGGCSNNSEIIDVSTNATLFAEGGIKAFALTSGPAPRDPNNLHTYPDSQVVGGSISPRPESAPMVTRAIIDHVYNCRTEGYDTASEPWAPSFGAQPIEACPSETIQGDLSPPPYISQLDAAVAAAVASVTSGTTGVWQIIGDEPGDDLACSATDGEVLTGPRWFVRCSASFGPGSLTFNDVDHIVFQNGFESGSGDNLYVNGSPTRGTVVSMGSGGLESSQGRVRLRNTFVYIRTTNTGQAGRIEVTANTAQFALQAPLDRDYCGPTTAGPLASCFAPLAVWSNYRGSGTGTSLNRIAGNAAGGVIGTVFTPNALFRFRGDGDEEPSECGSVGWEDLGASNASLSLEGSQFFARRIDLAGGAEIGMCPSPDSTVPTTPLEVVRLIR